MPKYKINLDEYGNYVLRKRVFFWWEYVGSYGSLNVAEVVMFRLQVPPRYYPKRRKEV